MKLPFFEAYFKPQPELGPLLPRSTGHTSLVSASGVSSPSSSQAPAVSPMQLSGNQMHQKYLLGGKKKKEGAVDLKLRENVVLDIFRVTFNKAESFR